MPCRQGCLPQRRRAYPFTLFLHSKAVMDQCTCVHGLATPQPSPPCHAQESEELAARMAAMRAEPSPLAAARAEQATTEADRGKFLKSINGLQARACLLRLPRSPFGCL